jgi:fumarate hydratase class II
MPDDAVGFRIEHDFLGDVQVPAEALWGAQTQRAVENFRISGWPLPLALIRALGLVKRAAAEANAALGLIDGRRADAIARAADEVARGLHDAQFPVDVFQTGSGTSSHMNANEVIARRANLLLDDAALVVHPNDHVNRGQSSNDVFPTAIHLAVLESLRGALLPALEALVRDFDDAAERFEHVVKLGRTHLNDALPLRLGQEIGGWSRQLDRARERVSQAASELLELPLGGSAVGTGVGADPAFAALAIGRLAERTGFALRQAPNLFEALSSRDGLVAVSSTLRGVAVALTRIANDLRWMASGPRGGLGEISLPELQPGSSIMPGKVNPVLPEAVLQVAAHVVGCDAAVAWAGAAGNFELNVMMPVMAWNVLAAIDLLAHASRALGEKAVRGMTANEARCRELVESSLALATPLATRIGYEATAAIAREVFATGRSVREVARERTQIPLAELETLLDPLGLTGGGRGEK